MGKTRVWIGGIASILYVLGLAVIAVLRWDELLQLELNELGDFLAGAFGPLAILWLVLGYFQQGEELRQNTEALHMQAQELKSSVEQQKQLVRAAEETVIAAERPIITVTAEINGNFIKANGRYELPIRFTVANSGRTHADKVFVHNRMVTLSGQDFLKEAWENLDALSRVNVVGIRLGTQVPPGQSRIICWTCSMSEEEVQKGRAYSDRNPGRLPSVALAAVVAYESMMDSQHVASVAYWVRAFHNAQENYVDLPDEPEVGWDELKLDEIEFDRGPMR